MGKNILEVTQGWGCQLFPRCSIVVKERYKVILFFECTKIPVMEVYSVKILVLKLPDDLFRVVG